MTATDTFAIEMQDLERRFATAAAADSDVYLPNFTPSAPVDVIFVAMEPSLGRWARTPSEAASRVAAGFRNFMWSPEDFILHYAARRTFIPRGWTYHITDVSKGAMTVAKANEDRPERYARWLTLLRDELALVAKSNAKIVAIGKKVLALLSQNTTNRNLSSVMHYSPLASRQRERAVAGREPEFDAFAQDMSMKDIIIVADEVMHGHGVPPVLVTETVGRLRKTTLTTSRKKLAFIYTTALAALPNRP
ncbi:MAG: hypothetical protein LZF86_40026 [Nitrospira sp.]|nr:MAG: hypothetical protein LZF86_40026 [Nitrospira sp.]